MDESLRQAHKYLYSSEEEARILKIKNESKDYLKDKITDLGEPDENGNILWYFDDPLILGETYTGLMLQRRVSEYTDEDKVLEILQDTGLEARCVRYVTTPQIDLDEVYACNQEGLLTDEEIDSMIVIQESYALVKIK